MSNSQLFRVHIDSKTLQNVREIDFSEHKFKERYDIQEWVESTPQILGEDLLIIAKEKTCFNGTRERPDLIAIDTEGNIVIIELKRDDSGADVHWQAIKYASYWSRFETHNILDVYRDYLELQNGKEHSLESVEDRILEFIDDENLNSINSKQRIILVSHRFSREVISASKWLIDEYLLDLKCVQLIPFYDKDLDVYNIMTNTLLPLPGLDDLLITPTSKDDYSKSLKGAVRKDDDMTKFMYDIKSKLFDTIESDYCPDKTSRWAGVSNEFRYFHFWYLNDYWHNWDLSYRVWCFNEKCTTEEANKLAIYLTLNKKNLLTEGMTELTYESIEVYISSLELEGFEVEGDETYVAIRKLYKINTLSTYMSDTISRDLEQLINATKYRIDELQTENIED